MPENNIEARMSFLGEIRRRKVFQVAAVYAVVAWLAVQVITAIEAPLNLPDWVDTLVIVFLGIGFPIALILAWIFDLTPQGIETTDDAPTATQAPVQSGQRFGQISQVLVLLAVGFLVVNEFLLQDATRPLAEPAVTPASPLTVTRFRVTPPAAAPLTNFGGYDMEISPDGSRLGWFGRSVDTGQIGLYVREIDELDARLIVGVEHLGPVENGNLFFSPDGGEIAFLSPDDRLMRVSVNGGTPRQIVAGLNNFLGATWGSDDTILYSTGNALWRVSAAGGTAPTEVSVSAPDGSGRFYAAPHWLPNGRSLLMTMIGGEDENLVVLDLESGELRTLIDGGINNPRYLPSGQIVYVRGTSLFAVKFDPNELSLTGDPVLVQQGIRSPGPGTAADFAISASGTLAYIPDAGGNRGETSDVVWVARDGQIIEAAFTNSLVEPADPRLSPDNRRLAIRSGRGVSASTLWMYDLNGRPPIPLADRGMNAMPVWSPDGSEVAFSSNRNGNFELFKVPADGSVILPVPISTMQPPANPRSWSASGELIVNRLGNDIMSTRPEIDAARVEIYATEDAEFDPALSPSGRWLAFASDRTGQPEIWVMRYPDGIPVRVSDGGGIEPRWSADERELYFLQGNAMMAVVFDATAELEFDSPAQLFTGNWFVSEATFVNSYDVAQDGRFLMISAVPTVRNGGGPQSIVVVQNWLGELAGLTSGQ